MQIGNTAAGGYVASYAQRSQATAAKTAGEETAGYDFTSMTREQMREAVGDMIESGQMTVDQSSCLVGMLGSSALMSVSGTSDPAYDASSVNFISQLQGAVAGAQWRHDDTLAKSYSQTLQVLQQYQEVGSSV